MFHKVRASYTQKVHVFVLAVFAFKWFCIQNTLVVLDSMYLKHLFSIGIGWENRLGTWLYMYIALSTFWSAPTCMHSMSPPHAPTFRHCRFIPAEALPPRIWTAETGGGGYISRNASSGPVWWQPPLHLFGFWGATKTYSTIQYSTYPKRCNNQNGLGEDRIIDDLVGDWGYVCMLGEVNMLFEGYSCHIMFGCYGLSLHQNMHNQHSVFASMRGFIWRKMQQSKSNWN